MIGLITVLAVRADAAPGGLVVADPTRSDADDDVAVETPYPAGAGFAADEPCDCDAPTLARIAATAPPLSEIVAHANATAGLARSEDPIRGWRARSRWSSLIPWISVRAGTSQSWRDIIDPGLAAATASTPTSLNHGLSYDVRLAWHLDHLLYDPNEPRFTSFELALRRNRRKLAMVASRAYFTWLRASVAVERDARWQLRLDEAASELDALTDGWFSEKLRQAGPIAAMHPLGAAVTAPVRAEVSNQEPRHSR